MSILVDILLLIFIARYAYRGVRNGFIPTLGLFVGVFVAFSISFAYSKEITDFVGIVFRSVWVNLVAFLIIFIVAQRVLGYVVDMIDRQFRKLTTHKTIYYADKILGALAGCAEGAFIIGACIYFIKTYNVHPVLVEWIRGSKVSGIIESIMRQVLAYL